jgi:TatD DNase family protein
MSLVDAHCHLADEAFDQDRAAVLDRARAAGVAHVVVIGESVTGSARAAALAAGRPGLSATAGVHPHEADGWGPEAERRVRELLARPEAVAVGETGLDYHYDHASRPAQRAAFEAHLALAAELDRPVVVHAREADADVADLLAVWGPRLPAVVLHSFSGGDDLFRAGMQIGAYFSFSGMITFKSWSRPRYLTDCPADRLLVETDAPFLAPVPHRGHRNEPAYVREVAASLARARGEPLADLVRRTAANARRVFGSRLETTLAPGEDAA